MRNAFENLVYMEEILDDQKAVIIESIYTKVYETFNHQKKQLHSHEFVMIDNCNFSEITKFLTSTDYYVLHDHLIHKGKQILKKGRLVTASKESLLPFFTTECRNHEEARFFIIPKDAAQGHILLNTEDWSFYVVAY